MSACTPLPSSDPRFLPALANTLSGEIRVTLAPGLLCANPGNKIGTSQCANSQQMQALLDQGRTVLMCRDDPQIGLYCALGESPEATDQCQKGPGNQARFFG